MRINLAYYLKFLLANISLSIRAILWCGFIGQTIAIRAIALPSKPFGAQDSIDAAAAKIVTIKAIVNNLPKQQLDVAGAVDLQQKPLELESWLLPFDATLKLLEIQHRQLPNGELELTSPYLLVRFNPHQLRSHPQLGTVIRIGDLQKLPGLTVRFDRGQSAIEFSYSLPKNPPQPVATAAPVDLDGLAAIDPPTASISVVQQRINLSGSANNQLNTQGEFKSVGTILGSSWYLRVEQPKLANLLTWGLSDAVVINQSPNVDWISGSQSPFWRRQGNPSGTYWGVTTILRQDFTPPTSLSGGNFVPNERLQSSRLGRTVVGQAQPGTVVRLVRGFNTNVVGQILVDSSGVFRFENVLVSKEDEFTNSYRLLLYPNGQLTADPQVRDVAFTTVPGQLPAGAGAWIASAGVNYNRQPDRFLGRFDGLQGGVAYRRGLSESITLGGGIISDPLAVRGLSEVFWQPTGIPLQASVSAVTGDRWDVVSNLNYQPAPTFNANFSSDKFSSRADLNWLLSPKFTAISKYDSLSGVAIGGNYNFSVAPNSNSNIQGTLDSNSFIRWSASHQQNNWLVGLQGNEISLNSEVSYLIPANGSTHNLVANYQTTRSTAPTTFGQLLWRYQSPTIQSELGYGWSGFGRGANAGIGVTLSPGLQLLGRYQGISAFTNRENFSLELQSTIDLQGGNVTTTQVEDLRTRGGIAIQPFFDRNRNAKQDAGEESFWHPSLIALDKKPLDPSRTTKVAERVEVRTAPGSYRLDLNPAHLPAYWRSSLADTAGKPLDSVRVNVALGSYTTISIPLTPMYTVKGIVLDAAGKPLANAPVVAIHVAKHQERRETMTKSDGSYEFIDLALGAYEISAAGQSQPSTIAIAASSPVLQQLNLQQTLAIDSMPSDRLTIDNCDLIFVTCWQGL